MRTYFLKKLLLSIGIYMLSISQMFGMTTTKEETSYQARQANLSGNYVSFSMPENFSKDFPAEDMIERLNLNDGSFFENNKPVTIIRRWWDFEDSGLFSRSVGTMMMSIHVYKIQDESKDISHPQKLIDNIFLDMQLRDKQENSGRAFEDRVLFPSYYQSFVEKRFNNQRWLRAGSANENESIMTFHYWIPLTEKHYITVEFNFAPDSRIAMRKFIDTYCRDMVEKIMASFDVIYSHETNFKAQIDKNSQLKLEDLNK